MESLVLVDLEEWRTAKVLLAVSPTNLKDQLELVEDEGPSNLKDQLELAEDEGLLEQDGDHELFEDPFVII